MVPNCTKASHLIVATPIEAHMHAFYFRMTKSIFFGNVHGTDTKRHFDVLDLMRVFMMKMFSSSFTPTNFVRNFTPINIVRSFTISSVRSSVTLLDSGIYSQGIIQTKTEVGIRF